MNYDSRKVQPKLAHLGKVSLEKKNFHTFGPDPPPLKSVKLKKFFIHTLTETYFGEKNLSFYI